MDVGEDAKHLLHHRGVCRTSVDRVGVAGDVGDQVGVVNRVHRRHVAVSDVAREAEIADELRPIVENILDELDRWLSVSTPPARR